MAFISFTRDDRAEPPAPPPGSGPRLVE